MYACRCRRQSFASGAPSLILLWQDGCKTKSCCRHAYLMSQTHSPALNVTTVAWLCYIIGTVQYTCGACFNTKSSSQIQGSMTSANLHSQLLLPQSPCSWNSQCCSDRYVPHLLLFQQLTSHLSHRFKVKALTGARHVQTALHRHTCSCNSQCKGVQRV